MKLFELRTISADEPSENNSRQLFTAKELCKKYPAFAHVISDPDFYHLSFIVGLVKVSINYYWGPNDDQP